MSADATKKNPDAPTDNACQLTQCVLSLFCCSWHCIKIRTALTDNLLEYMHLYMYLCSLCVGFPFPGCNQPAAILPHLISMPHSMELNLGSHFSKYLLE